jgi:hypothetical protein
MCSAKNLHKSKDFSSGIVYDSAILGALSLLFFGWQTCWTAADFLGCDLGKPKE